MISETAPAKLNLYLHVGPVRADGLHALKSLFVFTEDGDRIGVAPADELSLEIVGPFAGALDGLPVEKNLVMKAAALLRAAAGVQTGAALTLEKNLPIASGIGGGSADAAAALRALVRLWRLDIAPAALSRLAFQLGADVPACLSRAPIDVAGAGELLSPGPKLPPLWACLANPGVDMPTGPVFRAFDAAHPTPPAPVAPRLAGATYAALAQLMAESRNDLEAPARARAPEIAETLALLKASPGLVAARMSGSGATAFGLYSSSAAAQRAAKKIRAKGWWAMASPLAVG